MELSQWTQSSLSQCNALWENVGLTAFHRARGVSEFTLFKTDLSYLCGEAGNFSTSVAGLLFDPVSLLFVKGLLSVWCRGSAGTESFQRVCLTKCLSFSSRSNAELLRRPLTYITTSSSKKGNRDQETICSQLFCLAHHPTLLDIFAHFPFAMPWF